MVRERGLIPLLAEQLAGLLGSGAAGGAAAGNSAKSSTSRGAPGVSAMEAVLDDREQVWG